MSLEALLGRLRGRDIRLSLEAGRLKCNAPAGALSAELREELRARKAELVDYLRAAEALARHPEAVVPMQPRGGRIPVYAIGGHNGDFFAYQDLVKQLGSEQPFFGLHPPGLDGRRARLGRVEDLAAYFAAQIRTFHPGGPCIIAGYCAGGACALELARQLHADGAEVSFVALFGCPYPTFYRFDLAYWVKRMVDHARIVTSLPSWRERRDYLAERLHGRLTTMREARTPGSTDLLARLKFEFEQATVAAVRRHAPRRYAGRVCLFLPNREWHRAGGAARRWRAHAPHGEDYYGPDSVDPDRMLVDPHAAFFAELFDAACRDAHAAPLASPAAHLVKVALP